MSAKSNMYTTFITSWDKNEAQYVHWRMGSLILVFWVEHWYYCSHST